VNPRLALGISAGWIPLAFLFDGLTVLVLPFRISGDRQEATLIGVISFVGLGAALAIQPIAGTLSDRLRYRLGRRAFMALAAAPAIGGLWLLTGAATIPVLALGYLIVQVAASAIQAAQQTLIPEHVPPAFRGRAAGMKTAETSAAPSSPFSSSAGSWQWATSGSWQARSRACCSGPCSSSGC
jgi:MFS family permease